VSADVCDGDLARLARDGDAVAFRLLVERHQPMVRARARALCANPSDVDDIVQETFLQAFLALDRLRDPDRFAGWLVGITFNLCRSLRRRAPVTLLADLPEPLHPTSAGGLPSAEDMDRADALRAAVAVLPEGQRRAVTLHYYADVPAGQVGEAPGAARASLHKARLRLRAYLTEYRPDLVPAAGRTHMTTVRVARIERRVPQGPLPDNYPTHVMVLADDSGRRELPIWLIGRDSHRFGDGGGPSADELTGRLLRAAGTRVAAVDIDELGPEVTVTRIELSTPDGPGQVTARLVDGLALAVTTGALVRVADAVMERMAVPAGAGQAGPVPQRTARNLSIGQRPRYEPRNLDFASGLAGWELGGSFTENAIASHWEDYASAAADGAAVLSAAVPQPEGFSYLAQTIFADDFHGAGVVFRAQVRVPSGAGRAGLFLRARKPMGLRGPLTGAAALADPDNNIVMADDRDWTTREITAPIPEDTTMIMFGVFLAGPGRIELRGPSLARSGIAGLFSARQGEILNHS
jgi:RNA polymerase sigma-70 factor (ECF subfamily)